MNVLLEDADRRRQLLAYLPFRIALPLADVAHERERQDDKWGEQNHPDGTGSDWQKQNAESKRMLCDAKHAQGNGTWADILEEELAEALAEEDPAKLREELVQVAAVAVSWVEAIDRRQSLDG